MIPKVLKEVVDFLSKNLEKNTLPTGGVDGRSDSAKGEEKVIGIIQNENSKGIKKQIELAIGGMPESYPEYFKN